MGDDRTELRGSRVQGARLAGVDLRVGQFPDPARRFDPLRDQDLEPRHVVSGDCDEVDVDLIGD
jgi:hypothetical protein